MSSAGRPPCPSSIGDPREGAAAEVVPPGALTTMLDFLLLAPVASAGIVMRAARAAGLPRRFPRAIAVVDRIGLCSARHQFYELLVRPSGFAAS